MAIMETIGGTGSNDTSGNNNNGDKSFTALHHNYHPHYQHCHHLHVPTASYHIPDDVKKMGYMQKLKFGKRNTTKFFVLRLNSTLVFSNATLAYYDNEKKFREKQSPKRVILLSECFAVARIPDRRYVLGIYTKEDLLATAFDDEKPFIEWLQAIRSILYLMPEFQMRPIRDFRYIWQGHVKNVSADLSKNLLGTYRFCLLPNVLYFIRVDPAMDNSVFYEFPLSIIHQCGRRDRTFYLRVGRLSEVGAGEFWILTDDNLIAEHMHLKVSSFWAMSKNEKVEDSDDGTQFGMVISSSNNSLSQHRPSSSSNSSIADKSTSSYGTATAIANPNGNPYLLYDDPNKFSISPFMLHQMMSQLQSLCRNNRNVAGNVSSLSQSPTTSRERLYSGSWSRTASDCSNDDSGSSSAVTTPVASMIRDNVSSASSTNYQCSSPNGRKSNSFCFFTNNSNFSNDFQSKPNSSNSSLFTELDHNEHLIMDSFHSLYNPNQISTSSSPSSSSLLTSSPNHQHQISAPDTNEERGFGAELDFFPSTLNFAKNTLCTNCLNLYSLYSLQLAQQIQQMNAANNNNNNNHNNNNNSNNNNINNNGNNGTVSHNHSLSHRSSNGSIGSHNQSPVTSPKCHCSACFLASVVSASATALSSSCCNQHHYLPTIPAGEPADYVPMKPLNGENSTNIGNSPLPDNKLNEEDESSYLLMSPVSPQINNNSKSSNKASSNSFEFNLENVRSYISNDDEETSKDGLAKISNVNSNNNKQTAKMLKISTKTDNTNNSDDTIFNGLTRAYSTGSKPQPLAPSIGAQCANNSGLSTQNASLSPVTSNKTMTGEKKQNFGIVAPSTTPSQLRTRALSTGSHGMKFRAFLSSSKRKNKHSTTTSPTQNSFNDCQPQMHQINCGSGFSSEDNNNEKRSNKAASAPILSSLVQQGFRVRSLTLGSKPSSVVQQIFNAANGQHHQPQLLSLSPTSNASLSLCPFSGHSMVKDIISNLYGAASHQMACCATQHINSHSHYNLNLNLNHQYNTHNLSQNSYTVQSSSQVQSPLAPPPVVSPSKESDMMEIDYSSKSKERSQQKQHDNCTSGGDEKNVLLNDQTQLSSSMILQTKSKNDLKDIANGKNQKRDSSHNAITNNKSTNHWISTFKHTLSFQHSLKHNKQQHTKHSEQHSSDSKDNDYVLLNVGSSCVDNNYVQTKPSAYPVEQNTKTSKSEDAVYSMLNYNRRQPASSTLSNDSDEESSYVLMAPENNKSNNSHQQQKKSYKNSMKSLFLPGNSPLFKIN